MVKRPLDDHRVERSAKRTRFEVVDQLSPLSDELLLKILSSVPVSTLAVCQRVSRRLEALAGDPQLWKSAYYNRFVRPRASRVPSGKDAAVSANNLLYSSRIAKWFGEDHLVQQGKGTNWKRQYKLRHNWSRGSCDVSEIQVAERESVPPLLVQLHERIVVTVDSTAGLRAWSMKGEQRLLASLALRPRKDDDKSFSGFDTPTSLSIDTQGSVDQRLKIAVGFVNGGFSIYQLQTEAGLFVPEYTHTPSSNGTISAIAYASPYLITMTDAQLLSLYCFTAEPDQQSPDAIWDPPRLLSSLKSHTVWPPLSLSIRASPKNITASIAYALPTYLSGWSVGLQELRLTPEGNILESRLASAVSQGFTPLWSSPSQPSSNQSKSSSPVRATNIGSMASSTKPTSLSYSHPYLLASHPDNTLTLYLVTSTASNLSIGSGSRLWGHTSSVSGAHVGDRGKAVSVSSHGEELRVWELEGGVSSPTSRRRLAGGEASVQVKPEGGKHLRHENQGNGSESSFQRGTCHGIELGHSMCDLTMTMGWVGFDDEKVIVLREKGERTQALVIYDFT